MLLNMDWVSDRVNKRKKRH